MKKAAQQNGLLSSGKSLKFLLQIAPAINQPADFHHVVNHDIKNDIVLYVNSIIGIFTFSAGRIGFKGFGTMQPFPYGILHAVGQVFCRLWIFQFKSDIIDCPIEIVIKKRQETQFIMFFFHECAPSPAEKLLPLYSGRRSGPLPYPLRPASFPHHPSGRNTVPD